MDQVERLPGLGVRRRPGGVQGASDRGDQLDQAPRGDGVVGVDQLVEVLALDVLGDQRDPPRQQAQVVHLQDDRVVQQGLELRFVV